MSAPAVDRTPVAIITGFLGSGKTTLLNHLLQQPDMAGAAVIINEFGEVALDHLLIATPSETTVLLSNGCLCCAMRGDLVDTLADLYRKRRDGIVPRFDRVVVETTGLADPVPIIQSVTTDPELAPLYRLDSVVTLIDGVNGALQLDRHAESVKQAAVADRMIISKADLAEAASIAALRARLARLNPGADALCVEHGRISPQDLFGLALCRPEAGHGTVKRWLAESAFVLAEGHRRHFRAAQHAPRHDDRINAFCLYLDTPVTEAGLEVWLNMLAALRGANLLRVKGLLNVAGAPVAIHAVQTLIHEPVRLERWPDAERRSRLVFITRDMGRDEMEKTLPALALRAGQHGRALDPQTYAGFLAAAGKFR